MGLVVSTQMLLAACLLCARTRVKLFICIILIFTKSLWQAVVSLL